ncbi:MAG: ATP-dependent Clp protease ATP-binding subunit [bacterium]
MINQLDRLSKNCQGAIKSGADLAFRLKNLFIEPQHLLYGLTAQRGSVAAELLAPTKITIDDIKNNIIATEKIYNEKATTLSNNLKPVFSEDTKKIIIRAFKIAYANHHPYAGSEHLLAALLEAKNEKIKHFFQLINLSEKTLSDQILSALRGVSKMPELTQNFKIGKAGTKNKINKNNQALNTFGRDLTNTEIQKRIDPVIGREEEISRVIQILSRRTKNNPLLLGDPGTGKTAIVEGLAKKIAIGDVPEVLKNKKIYALDLVNTVAGTMFRGEFENRLKQILDEARHNSNVIIFIDEIHNIVGAGSASGSMDAANILKPALARGEIRCIGATTFADYRKSIENDPALGRRFQVVKVAEPTAENTEKIIHGIKSYYEEFHQVKITDDAIKSAVTLSQKYLPEKFLPDKAIDLIDEASSGIKINAKVSLAEQTIRELDLSIKELNKLKRQAIAREDFEQALTLKERADKIKAEVDKLILDKKNNQTAYSCEISTKDIAKVISKMTGIPTEDLVNSEKKKVLNLDKELAKKVIGQSAAIHQITDLIQRAKAGLLSANKPLASLMLVGPSGTGKTMTAKTLAKMLFNDDKALIKIDMSEFSEKFNISKLIGAPAGYVGYKESGTLTEKVKHKPYSLVLFDEIEKANRDVLDLLLQILDEGYLTDASGTKINFQNTIIIITSNIGTSENQQSKNLGFEHGNKKLTNQNAQKEKTLSEVNQYFKVEFLNRLDKIIYFNSLTERDLEKIVKIELENLNSRLAPKNIKILPDTSAIKLIAEKSASLTQGARAIKRQIQDLVETSLAKKILAEEITENSTIQLFAKNGIINIVKQ